MLTPFWQHDIVEQNTAQVSKKKLKILFYHAGSFEFEWFYPAVLQFKTYIELYFPDTAQHLDWCIPIQTQVTDQQLISAIKDNNVDVLCTSHYIWNHDFLNTQLARIAPEIKDQSKIISGGPSIDAHLDVDFFKKHPYVDYAVFAAGEQAFADILTHLVFDKPLLAFNTSNCAWKHAKTNKVVVAEYKFVKMIDVSPFVYNEPLFTKMTKDFFKKSQNMWLPYTLTRGCPYSCTFCDWNSGFGNKVSRRKNTYQQEIDLFQKLGIKNIYLADANVGQYQEDVDMIEYFAYKNIHENAEFHVGGNFSKLKKENNLKIFHAMAKSKMINKTFNISIQDINQQVLKNIERPDVGWDVHVAMADELRQSYPHLLVKAQLICCLPGQTVESWRETLKQVVQKNIFPIIFLNEPLPASPAMYDPEYQRRFQFEYVKSNRVFDGAPFASLIAKKSNSFTQQDVVHMVVLSVIYQALSAINLAMCEHSIGGYDIELAAESIIASDNYQNLYNNLLENWITENNFYFTTGFSGTPMVVGNWAASRLLVADLTFINHVKNILPTDLQMPFAKLYFSHQFTHMVKEIFADFD